MRFRTSLRYRVTLAFALLGMVVSLVLAGSLYLLFTDMEQRLLKETLSAELEDYITRYNIDPATPPPSSTTISTYVITADTDYAPEALTGLEPGLHQVRLAGKQYYAEVRLEDDRRFVVLYNDARLRRREDRFKLYLGIGVVMMTLVSAMLGYWQAGRVTAPVGNLARRVASLRPEDQPTSLSEYFTDDEVGMLAADFDNYLQRLNAFIEREQAFTADVSHELRTPLAVIEGAAEVLLDDSTLDDKQRARVQRVARSAHEMTEIVSALLLLAREENKEIAQSDCVVTEALQQVLDSHQHLLQKKSVEIKLDIRAGTVLPVECTLLRIVLANLLTNALNYTEHGYIAIVLDEKGISFEDTGIGIPKKQIKWVFKRFYTGSASGQGIGLSLVRRICQCYGWDIDIESCEDRGTTFLLSF